MRALAAHAYQGLPCYVDTVSGALYSASVGTLTTACKGGTSAAVCGKRVRRRGSAAGRRVIYLWPGNTEREGTAKTILQSQPDTPRTHAAGSTEAAPGV